MKNLEELLQVMDENIEAAELENEEIINHLYSHTLSHKVDLLEVKDYSSNPYYQNVHPPKKRIGNLELFYDHYVANQMFLYDEVKVGPSYQEESQIGYFKENFPFLAIKENGSIWMSVTPHEINTMKAPLSLAKGNILILGLGLGYFPYMAALKDEVKEITIIENNPKVISIFKEIIFHYFAHQEKVRIIEEDAIEYFSKSKAYDFVFADLWRQPYDGLPLYLALKRREQNGPIYTYWVEKSMLCLLRRASLIVLDELNNGATAEDFQHSENQDDKLINAVYAYIVKRGPISNLNDKELQIMAKELDFC